MEFGIQIEPQFGFSFADVVAIARDAEAAGLHAVWLSDHLFLNAEATNTNCLEVWTLLAALSQVTTRIRLGTLVTCQSYRNPALLAKIGAGVDHMSNGRLEFGVGAGWKELEYRAYGYAFAPPAVRVAQLVDTLEIVRRLWTEDRATYRGRHYSVQDALCAPKPVQKPHPRIWVAGAKPRMVRVMARYADAINVNPSFFATTSEYAAVVADLERECRAIGRDPGTILRSHFGPVVVGERRDDVDAIVAALAARARTTPREWLAARPAWVVGTPEIVVERIRAFAALGVRYWHLLFPYEREREMLRVFARRVMPALA